jgi:hypothetical protein
MMEARLTLRLGRAAPTSAAYSAAARHLEAALHADDASEAREALSQAAEHRDRFLAAAAFFRV